jgi:hypothetical protein
MKYLDLRIVALAVLLFALSSCLGGLGCLGSLLGCSEADSLIGEQESQLDTTDHQLQINEITFDFGSGN